ncbi:MAG: DUF4153 domain-containing protein [Actinomycetota bacterium]|nr:DUF4153 domain-containing protein [Actinomycetota bacterium]
MDKGVIENLKNPEKLERLYRADKEGFIAAFKELDPESLGGAYGFWQARISADEEGTVERKELIVKGHPPIHIVIMLALLAGTLAKLPAIFGIDELFFYSRFAGLILFATLSAYFFLRASLDKKLLATTAAIFFASLVWMNFIPNPQTSDTSLLSMLHLPVLLWLVTGVAFAGGNWKSASERIDYIKFNGELLVFIAIIQIAGMMLTGMTTALFMAMGIDIADFYVRWIAVYGAAAMPIVAAHLVLLRPKDEMRISAVIAKIFSPLFLITLTIYLIVMIAQRRSPFTDRDFLIVFNAMMLFVLALAIYSITEKGRGAEERWLDVTIVGLLTLGLIVDGVALSAILFRLASYGLTPNRVAVLGLNLITMANVAYLAYSYLQFTSGKKDLSGVMKVVADFLPIYGAWSVFITFVFPVLYWFK